MVSLLRLLMLFLVMVYSLTATNNTMAQIQGSQERPVSAQQGDGQLTGQASSGDAIRGSSGGSAVRVVPFITVSERYDSNIRLTTPKVFDYVTAVQPGARVEYRDDLVQGTLTGGFRSEVYARNSELNYVGANASMAANLDNAAGKMFRGLGLRLSDSMLYTPVPPAFLTPEAPEASFYHGIQVGRSNALMNAANVQGTYAITQVARFNASYSHQMRRYLDQPSQGANSALFNTIVQSFLAGPQYQITPTQLIGASYQYQHLSSEPTTGGMGNITVVNGAMVTWKTSLTRELTLDVSPGVSILTSAPEKLRYTMSGSLRWSDGTTTAGLLYIRSVRPGLYISSSTMLSDIVTASLSRTLTSQWSVSALFSYAINKSIGQTSLQFESFGETGSLNYTFYSGIVASASLTNYNFSYSGTQNSQYDRQLAMFSLRAEWN